MSLTSHDSISVFQKSEVNLGSLSQIIESERTCNRKNSLKNKWAISIVESLSLNGRKWTLRVNWSPKVVIEVKDRYVRGRFVTKSIATEPHWQSGRGIRWAHPKGFFRLSFCCWQNRQPAQYERTSPTLFFQWWPAKRPRVFWNPTCPDSFLSWASCRMFLTRTIGTQTIFSYTSLLFWMWKWGAIRDTQSRCAASSGNFSERAFQIGPNVLYEAISSP